MVSVMPIGLADVLEALRASMLGNDDLPCHVGAFCAWITGNESELREQVRRAIDFDGQARHPEHISALGFGAAASILDPAQLALTNGEITHLSGRNFFAPGRPLRIEADGVALLGIALGAMATKTGGNWLTDLLRQASATVDPWQGGLVTVARMVCEQQDLAIAPVELAVGVAERLGWGRKAADVEAAWKIVVSMQPHGDGISRDAVRLAVFEFALETLAHVSVGAAGVRELEALVTNAGRALRLWRYEDRPRTPNSLPTRWEIENEYHVQSFLWAILAPVFADLEEEENLPSVGHKNPRADLGVPSLRTIVEVKFLRSGGQAALAKITEEVAADASLYLSTNSGYDKIIAVVWDDVAQTEQHHELKTGLESINGVKCAVIIPRPMKMKR